MLMITKLSGKTYGRKINLYNKETIGEIKEMVECGDPIVIVDDINDLEKLGIEIDNLIMVDNHG